MRFELGERPRFSIPGRPRELARAESLAFSQHLLDRYLNEQNATHRSLGEDYQLDHSSVRNRIERARQERAKRRISAKAEAGRGQR